MCLIMNVRTGRGNDWGGKMLTSPLLQQILVPWALADSQAFVLMNCISLNGLAWLKVDWFNHLNR